jgi:hypothetical protein
VVARYSKLLNGAFCSAADRKGLISVSTIEVFVNYLTELNMSNLHEVTGSIVGNGVSLTPPMKHFKPASTVSSHSIPDVIVSDTSLQSEAHSDLPLLSNYNRDELIAREKYLLQIEQRGLLEIAARERKDYADSLIGRFELTGSDLPADSNPRQLHLF